MGSSLGPVLDGIFMVDLKRSLVPLLTEVLSFWILMTLRHKLHLQVKNLALNLMLKIGPNLNKNMLFILVNVQNRIVLMLILVNLLGESLSEL